MTAQAERSTLNALTATTTTTSLINGGAELPFFLDGTKPYSGAIGGARQPDRRALPAASR